MCLDICVLFCWCERLLALCLTLTQRLCVLFFSLNGSSTGRRFWCVWRDSCIRLSQIRLRLTHSQIRLWLTHSQIRLWLTHSQIRLWLTHSQIRLTHSLIRLTHSQIRLTHSLIRLIRLAHSLIRLTHSLIRLTHSPIRLTHSQIRLRLTHSPIRLTHSQIRLTHSRLRLTHSRIRRTLSLRLMACGCGLSRCGSSRASLTHTHTRSRSWFSWTITSTTRAWDTRSSSWPGSVCAVCVSLRAVSCTHSFKRWCSDGVCSGGQTVWVSVRCFSSVRCTCVSRGTGADLSRFLMMYCCRCVSEWSLRTRSGTPGSSRAWLWTAQTASQTDTCRSNTHKYIRLSRSDVVFSAAQIMFDIFC